MAVSILNESKNLNESDNNFKLGSIFSNAGSKWAILDQAGEDTLIVELDSEGQRRNRFVVAWGLQPDGTWNQGHYFQDEKRARAFFARRNSEEVVINGYTVIISDEQPEYRMGTYLELVDSHGESTYWLLESPKAAQELYKIIVSSDEDVDYLDVDDVSIIRLCFTDSQGQKQVRWQDYADNFARNQLNTVNESVELTEDPSEALKKIGYEQNRNKNGEILYTSDELYSPDISVFGSIIEVLPLSDLPISMTIEDHGKMIKRLADVQVVLEHLK